VATFADDQLAAMAPRLGVSVVLPCRDRQADVADAVRRAAAAAGETSEDYEIIVVDDGSRDATRAEVAGFVVGSSSRVRLLVHPRPLGYGAALRTGLAAARMPWVLLVDPDLRLAVGDFEKFAVLAEAAQARPERRRALWRRLLRFG
jgi:glycosyltransferase involved in cell wall biosynthesis